MAQWFSIQSGLSRGESIYSLNISEGSTTPGTQIILYSFSAAANELFQITDGGLIVSQMDPSLVLALGGDGTSVVIAALSSGNAAQQWDFVQGGLLVNRQNQQAMAISGGSAVSGAAIVTAPQDHGDPSQVWSPVASFPAHRAVVLPAQRRDPGRRHDGGQCLLELPPRRAPRCCCGRWRPARTTRCGRSRHRVRLRRRWIRPW